MGLPTRRRNRQKEGEIVQTEVSDKPIILERHRVEKIWKRKLDFYGEPGCCLTCTESMHAQLRGVRYGVHYGGKYYDCLCFDCKCVPCDWYEDGECMRKHHADY